MKVKIYPGFAKGSVRIPPSKSILHRAIICACLADGKSTIKNVSFSDDIKATINAFKQLGIKIEKMDNALNVYGNGNLSFFGDEEIDCKESGSTMRFLIPLLCNDKGISFTGKHSLLKRPLSVYEDIFINKNIKFDKNENNIYIKGEIDPGLYKLPGNVSSQFISGLLFALPLKTLDSKIEITGKLESKKYVDLTIDVLKSFNINIIEDNNVYFISGNQTYKSCNYSVEADYSQLAFFAVAGIINGDIKISNVNKNTLQPDSVIIDLIRSMGGKVLKERDSLRFVKSETFGIKIDISQCPDIGPILSILGGVSKGETLIYNANRLRIKETDRLLATNEILSVLGIKTNILGDSYIIQGSEIFRKGTIDSYNDHRMAMSTAIAALRAEGPLIIERAEAINKSYPDFFDDLQSLGIRIEYI
jgi:3-phosphoshikimate 1-carboxyvinyltransferase